MENFCFLNIDTTGEGDDKMCYELVDVAICAHVDDLANSANMKELLSAIVLRLAVGGWQSNDRTRRLRVSLTVYWGNGYTVHTLFKDDKNVNPINVVNENDLDTIINGANFVFTAGTGDVTQCFDAMEKRVMREESGMRFYAEHVLIILSSGRDTVNRDTINGILGNLNDEIRQDPLYGVAVIGIGTDSAFEDEISRISYPVSFQYYATFAAAFEATTSERERGATYAINFICPPNNTDGIYSFALFTLKF